MKIFVSAILALTAGFAVVSAVDEDDNPVIPSEDEELQILSHCVIDKFGEPSVQRAPPLASGVSKAAGIRGSGTSRVKDQRNCAPTDAYPVAITTVTDLGVLFGNSMSWELYDPSAGAYPGMLLDKSYYYFGNMVAPYHRYSTTDLGMDPELCCDHCYNIKLKRSSLGSLALLRVTTKAPNGEDRPPLVDNQGSGIVSTYPNPLTGPTSWPGSSIVLNFCMPPCGIIGTQPNHYNIYATNNCCCNTGVKAKFKLRDATPGNVINGQQYLHVVKTITSGATIFIGRQDRAKVTFKKLKPNYLSEPYKQRYCNGQATYCTVQLCP